MKYSIITPCYKQENLICETLDSVLAQKSKDWEHLCTDDGGPDRTGEVLDDYVRSHCNEIKEYQIEQGGEKKRVVEGRVRGGGVLKVIHQKNAGMCGARNAAKQISTGEWIINLDGDDLLSPWALDVLDECIEKCPNADMLWGGFKRFADGSNPEWGEKAGSYTIVDAAGPIRRGMSASAFQQMVFNRKICGDVQFVGANWSEERLYTAKCVVRMKKFIKTSANIYGYREHPGQFTVGGMTLDECKCYLDTTREILDMYVGSDRGVEYSVFRGLVLHWLEWIPCRIVKYLSRTDRKEMWTYWFDSLPLLREYPRLSPWCKFVISICISFPVVPVAFVLCFVPDWLKRRGFHR